MRFFNILSRAFALSILALCVGVFVSKTVMAQPEGGVNWVSSTIYAVGEGAAPKEGDPAKRRLMAKRAAVVDGYRKLAEMVEGVSISSRTTVKNFEVENDEVRSSVNALIKGVKIVEENITSDGGYEVKLELPLFGQGGLASVVLDKKVLESSLVMRRSVPIAQQVDTSAPSSEKMTGIIVDARNLGAKAAMLPAILDEAGKEVYLGGTQINNDDLVAQGPVSYCKTLEDAQKNPRVGDSPLVVRAKRYSGPFHADLIIPDQPAQEILRVNAAQSLFKNLPVAIVL